MTRSIRGSRRATLLSGLVGATALLATGCGAGQVSETANKQPSVQGVNVQTSDNAYKVRGLYVEYPGESGLASGANAALNTVIYNDTPDPVTVTVTTDSARQIVLTGTAGSASPSGSASPAESASPSGSASPSASPSGSASPAETASPDGDASPSSDASPSGGASPSEGASPSAGPSAPAGEPARIEIPALGYVQLNVQNGRHLQLVGLNEALRTGQQVNLTFDFGGGRTVSTPVPVGVPLSPNPPASPIVHREGGEESGQEGSSGHGG
ncbi:hypothetical protein [Micromonospora matsumotoense]|uniref:hypothetical protein n=1 Tax=Micromonospora matsumotoense TaxID=121616 RepID=UPI0033C5FC8F